MKEVNKNTELNNTDKKLHISDVMVSSFDRFGAGIKKYGYDSEFRKECECLLKQQRHDELNEFFDRWDVPKN
jgi:hypothetical protein